MRRILLTALSAFALALPAAAQPTWIAESVLVEPRFPTASDPIRLTLAGRGQCVSFHPRYEDATGAVVVDIELHDCVSVPGYHPIRDTVEIGPLPAGRHVVEVPTWTNPPAVLRESIEVSPDDGRLHLRAADEDHFVVEASFRLPGETGLRTAPGVRHTRDAGSFYFFDPENVEVTAKIVDGRAVNGHWWVFLANMTTLELEIEVTRCPPDGLPVPCVTKTYVQPPGQNRNFLDTSTF